MRFIKLSLILLPFIVSSCGTENSSSQDSLDLNLNLFPVKVNNEFSFRDFNGKSIEGNSYEYLSFFYNEIALGSVNIEDGNTDFINTSGDIIFNSDLVDVSIGNSEIWIAKPNEAPQLLKKNGEKIFTASKDMISVFPFQNGFAAAEFWNSETKESLWGFINQTGQTVIKPQFSELLSNSYFNEGKCPVKNDDEKYGYIDTQGKLIIPYQYDYCEPFIDNRAIFGKRTKGRIKYGLINEDGLYVLSPKYYQLHNDGEMYMVQEDNGWGWIDADGNVAIAPQFEEALPFNNEKYAPVKIGDDYGFIDTEGRIVVNPQYKYATSFHQGKALIQDDNLMTGVIGNDLEIDLIPQFDVDLPYYSNKEYFMFMEESSIRSDYFEIQSVVELIEEFSIDKSLFNMSFGQLSNTFGLILDEQSRYHLIQDTTLFSFGYDRSIDAKVGLWGLPSELVEKTVGEGFYQRRIQEYELRPDLAPKGFLLSFDVSPYHRKAEVEQLLIEYLSSKNAEAVWENDVDSGFESYSNYRTFKNQDFTYEIFQTNGVQYFAIYH